MAPGFVLHEEQFAVMWVWVTAAMGMMARNDRTVPALLYGNVVGILNLAPEWTSQAFENGFLYVLLKDRKVGLLPEPRPDIDPIHAASYICQIFKTLFSFAHGKKARKALILNFFFANLPVGQRTLTDRIRAFQIIDAFRDSDEQDSIKNLATLYFFRCGYSKLQLPFIVEMPFTTEHINVNPTADESDAEGLEVQPPPIDMPRFAAREAQEIPVRMPAAVGARPEAIIVDDEDTPVFQRAREEATEVVPRDPTWYVGFGGFRFGFNWATVTGFLLSLTLFAASFSLPGIVALGVTTYRGLVWPASVPEAIAIIGAKWYESVSWGMPLYIDSGVQCLKAIGFDPNFDPTAPPLTPAYRFGMLFQFACVYGITLIIIFVILRACWPILRLVGRFLGWLFVWGHRSPPRVDPTEVVARFSPVHAPVRQGSKSEFPVTSLPGPTQQAPAAPTLPIRQIRSPSSGPTTSRVASTPERNEDFPSNEAASPPGGLPTSVPISALSQSGTVPNPGTSSIPLQPQLQRDARPVTVAQTGMFNPQTEEMEYTHWERLEGNMARAPPESDLNQGRFLWYCGIPLRMVQELALNAVTPAILSSFSINRACTRSWCTVFNPLGIKRNTLMGFRYLYFARNRPFSAFEINTWARELENAMGDDRAFRIALAANLHLPSSAFATDQFYPKCHLFLSNNIDFIKGAVEGRKFNTEALMSNHPLSPVNYSKYQRNWIHALADDLLPGADREATILSMLNATLPENRLDDILKESDIVSMRPQDNWPGFEKKKDIAVPSSPQSTSAVAPARFACTICRARPEYYAKLHRFGLNHYERECPAAGKADAQPSTANYKSSGSGNGRGGGK